MKIFAKYKFFKISLLVILFYIGSMTFFDLYLGYHRYIKRLEMMTLDLAKFVYQNQGRLPMNKQEFEPYVNSKESLEFFQIHYGIHMTELDEKNGQLYDSQGNKILLIKGDSKFPFIQKKYEQCTLEVFEKSKVGQLKGTDTFNSRAD